MSKNDTRHRYIVYLDKPFALNNQNLIEIIDKYYETKNIEYIRELLAHNGVNLYTLSHNEREKDVLNKLKDKMCIVIRTRGVLF